MAARRLMMVGLDGLEPTIVDRMTARGALPAIAELLSRAAIVPLDHGSARHTGLAWEHVATGLAPGDAGRWNAIDFDPSTYRASQRGTDLPPFPAALPCRTVVFDPPYFDMRQAPNVLGMTNWGAHDPGVPTAANPARLESEIADRFGDYPARNFIYGFVWPSQRRTRRMADALVVAVERRTAICEWLFGEGVPDWDLGLVVAGEFHSAAEALWHGVDEEHPLHEMPSADAARDGIERVYAAADRMIARLLARFPDTHFAFFNLHGMGRNVADVPAMALLPELLYRAEHGPARLQPGRWRVHAKGFPVLDGDAAGWSEEIIGLTPLERHQIDLVQPAIRWMPAARYASDWPRMRWFAMPAYYDGQVRVNLRGRERNGMIAASDYDRACDEVEALLSSCKNALGGGPVVREIVRTPGDPLARPASRPDLTIHWHKDVLGLAHPALGTIGPLPWRRTGGHTGGEGFAWFAGPNVRPGRIATRSAFDVVPTVVEMLGCERPARMSGTSFARQVTGVH